MIKPRVPLLPRNRYLAVTLGTAAIVLVAAIFLAGAPRIPSIAGVAFAVAWLLWRAPAA
jgi:hypothetical protein